MDGPGGPSLPIVFRGQGGTAGPAGRKNPEPGEPRHFSLLRYVGTGSAVAPHQTKRSTDRRVSSPKTRRSPDRRVFGRKQKATRWKGSWLVGLVVGSGVDRRPPRIRDRPPDPDGCASNPTPSRAPHGSAPHIHGIDRSGPGCRSAQWYSLSHPHRPLSRPALGWNLLNLQAPNPDSPSNGALPTPGLCVEASSLALVIP